MPSGDVLTCEEEQTDPRSVNGCLGDILQGRERSCLRMFVPQQPPPRTVAMWRRGWRLSARPQKKRPAHTACRPAVFSIPFQLHSIFCWNSYLPLFSLPFSSPFSASTGPTAHCCSPSARQDGLSLQLYFCSIFQNSRRMFYLPRLDTCSGWLRERRSTICQQESQSHGVTAGGCEIHRVTPRMCVFIPQMHQLVKQFLSVFLMSWYHELGLNNGQLSCDWLMAMWAGPWQLCCLRLHQGRDGWRTHFLPPPAHLRTIYREAFQCLDSV